MRSLLSKSIKIKNYYAGEIYGYKLGTRDYLSFNDAVLDDSLLSRWLKKNGMTVEKNSTNDLICIDFSFGHNDFEGEVTKLNRMIRKLEKKIDEIDISNGDKRKITEKHLLKDKIQCYTRAKEKIKELNEINPEIFKKVSKNDMRVEFYTKKSDSLNNKVEIDGIDYEMLYRSTSKAKTGKTTFINKDLYNETYNWMTMGLGDLENNNKIVEMSAYMGLVASSIIDTIKIKPSEILFLEDQKSECEEIANIVYVENGICKVKQEETTISNWLWDGMSLIDSDFLEEHIKQNGVELNSMVLLRNHFFKSCAFKTHIQKFMKERFEDDYETKTLIDMFGAKKAKNIKLIVTDKSLKWLKFADLMGENPYKYWCGRLKEDGYIFGIVKTDHPSKLGSVQKMSAQMINSLELTRGREEEEIKEIVKHGVERVVNIKADNNEYVKFLREKATSINHYNMLADLYIYNNKFANNKWWKTEKRKVIHDYVETLRRGEIPVSGDNLTVIGNPYSLLLHAIGENWKDDNTLVNEDGAIQCYTKKFDSDKYITGFRSPHNSPHNILYLHNMKSDILDNYFDFSENVIVINMIKTTAQSRANSMDMDSDFIFATNNPIITDIGKRCYKKHETIINAIEEKPKKYINKKESYAKMDNELAKAQDTIGKSSNLAQRALSWAYDEYSKTGEFNKDLEENIIILATLAQVAIDQCKKSFEIDPDKEVKRIQKLYVMKEKKSPRFMHWTNKIKKINTKEYKCPMDLLEKEIDSISNNDSPTGYENQLYFNLVKGKANSRHKNIIRGLIEDYDNKIKEHYAEAYKSRPKNDDKENYEIELLNAANRLSEEINRIKIDDKTMNRLIAEVFVEKNSIFAKYRRKLLNALYNKHNDKSKFLSNFNNAEIVLEKIKKQKEEKEKAKKKSSKLQNEKVKKHKKLSK